MRDVIKTLLLVGIVLIIAFISLFIRNNADTAVNLLTRTKLAKDSDEVKIAYEKLDELTYLRKARLNNQEITNREIIYFALDNLQSDNYQTEVVGAQKITCEVGNILFQTSTGACYFKVIQNETIKKIANEYFNITIDLEYPDIDYHGYYCKNDGNQYYCQHENYLKSILEYTTFDSAYQEKDKLVIKEYYLRIDIKDTNRCIKFLGDNYCNNYLELERPVLLDEIIKSNGVLYEHTFKKREDDYYLETSRIIN